MNYLYDATSPALLVEELMRKNQRKYYDEESIQTDIDTLSQEALHQIYKKIDLRRL